MVGGTEPSAVPVTLSSPGSPVKDSIKASPIPVRSARPSAVPAASGRPVPSDRIRRIVSLDWVRGWMLVASVCANSLLLPPEWLDHAEWDSVHVMDLIFPIFVTLSGCGLAFAMHRGVKPLPLLRRAVILLLAGLVYNAVVLNSWSLDSWRVTGVLQLYAVVVVVLGLLHLLTRSWIGWALITVAISCGHTLLLALYAVDCPDKLLTRECNPAGPIDVALFGAGHVYGLGAVGHDPEGVVGILGALICASAGATVGHLLLSARAGSARRNASIRRTVPAQGTGRRVSTSVLPIAAVAAGLWAASWLSAVIPERIWGVTIPAMKRLWTAPFAFEVAAGTAIVLLLGHLLLDRKSVSRPLRLASYPLVALGRNSLLVYFGSHVVMSLLSRALPSGSNLATEIAQTIAIQGHVQTTWTAAILALWLVLACVLHRFRIYLRP